MFDPRGYARDVLQIGGTVKHITTVEDYWVDCRDEFDSRDCAFDRLIVGQVKTYGIDPNVEGLEDDGQPMYSNTYLNQRRNTTISFEPRIDVEEDLDTLMEKIIKRTRKWVEWTSKKSQTRGTPTQASPSMVASSSSQGAMTSVMPTTTQGLAQPTGGGDQSPDKNIPLDKTCHDGSRLVISTQAEEKKEEEKKA